MTFGRDMPGVGCTEYARQGAAAEGCFGNLPISSIRVGTGESCTFYSNGDCSGDKVIFHRVNNCATFNRRTVGSYQCVRLSLFLAPLREELYADCCLSVLQSNA